MFPLRALLALTLFSVAHTSPWTKVCVHSNTTLDTACDANAKCCSHPFSNSGWGCCALGSDAVCCANGYTCCPAGTTCQDSGTDWQVITQCVDSSQAVQQQGQQICKPGAALPFSNTKHNVLILGDSVSIGYTPAVAALLNETAFVQHSPFSGDGGAEETAYGWQCIEYFLRASDGTMQVPDLIYFNWGLHNLVQPGGHTIPGQSGLTTDYLPFLEKIADRILQMGTKVLFGLTSPEMCDKTLDDTVVSLNAQAQKLMMAKAIPFVDLHQAVIDKCGPVPQDTCLGEAKGGCPHYNGQGYEYIANSTIVPAIRQMLGVQ